MSPTPAAPAHLADAFSERQNVLFITADQWRGDCLSAAAHPLVQTPALDRLAREGMRFTRHFANCAPCSPARASLYTGRYQMTHRVCSNGSPLDHRFDNLARAARRAGYEPTLFGYTDTSVDPRRRHPNDPALRSYENVLPGFAIGRVLNEAEGAWRRWLQRHTGIDGRGAAIHGPQQGPDDPPQGRGSRYRAEHSPTAFLIDELVDWIATQNDEFPNRRWFAHLSLLRPHPPFIAAHPFNVQVDPVQVSGFAGGGHWRPASAMHPYVDWAARRLCKSDFIAGADGLVIDWSDADRRQIAATYYGMIGEVDQQLGRLFDALRAAGHWQTTAIVFTSDHGEMLGDHGLFGKFGFYDSAYHIPLIIRDPARPELFGQVSNRFTEAVDILPMLCSLFGLPVDPALDGTDPREWRSRKPADARQAVHWEYDFRDIGGRQAESDLALDSRQCNLAVRRESRFKYVHFAGLPPLLFDLYDDPEETTNLADDPACSSTRLRMAEALLDWRAAHLDQELAFTWLGADGPVSRRADPYAAPE